MRAPSDHPIYPSSSRIGIATVSVRELVAAVERAESVLVRRPSAGLRDDAPGVARWKGGLQVAARHASGDEIVTDMPVELGGRGGVSPGWMVRAGLASCTATCIAMIAAREGVELDLLEVEIASRSDLRGFFGMAEADGSSVYPGPQRLTMAVRIAAQGVPPARLRALVRASERVSPMLAVFRDSQAIGISVEVAG